MKITFTTIDGSNPIDLITQARAISSGTMATLTGLRTYHALDHVQALFTGFCRIHRAEFLTWQSAWVVFSTLTGYDKMIDRLKTNEAKGQQQ